MIRTAVVVGNPRSGGAGLSGLAVPPGAHLRRPRAYADWLAATRPLVTAHLKGLVA